MFKIYILAGTFALVSVSEVCVKGTDRTFMGQALAGRSYIAQAFTYVRDNLSTKLNSACA